MCFCAMLDGLGGQRECQKGVPFAAFTAAAAADAGCRGLCLLCRGSRQPQRSSNSTSCAAKLPVLNRLPILNRQLACLPCAAVTDVRHILDAARQGCRQMPASAPAKPSVPPAAAELPRGARPARPSELVELRSTDSPGMSTSGSSKRLDGDAAGEVQQPERGGQAQQAQQQQGAAGLAGAGSGTAALPDVATLQAAVMDAAAATSGGGSTCSAEGAGHSAGHSGERKRGAPVTHIPEVGQAGCGCKQRWWESSSSLCGGIPFQLLQGGLHLPLRCHTAASLAGPPFRTPRCYLLGPVCLAECAPRGGGHCGGSS